MLTNDDMKRIEEDRGPGDLTLQIDMLTKQ